MVAKSQLGYFKTFLDRSREAMADKSLGCKSQVSLLIKSHSAAAVISVVTPLISMLHEALTPWGLC